jgi:hypothetical protein
LKVGVSNARLIARTIGRDAKCVQRQLELLEDCGVVDCRTAGGRRAYRLSARNPVREEFEAMFRKTRDLRYYPGPGGGEAFPRARATRIDAAA